ncbi:acyl-CoA dehydrogenase, C-terminal domain protein [Mycolicibacterium hassiacum DSM 44199]|uniref:Acyl-CoA dehydrogenase, C-terminal domain protein n=1 Tax=Mycolicibacterium hassiacum (strain DSM 44199 / CIP 105218 / JCM 12690 / 3849) TaxID=1122247 RepID=K5BCZ1_MYCHD|nr:acyl-CoA dehydrogenase [Mycolicibacterium hassiacum]EKF21161.1 acyl-CoA dehydrogenase, C-terminal domain protein [Mycolicibacterium hassiacum DSM 44199]MBX5485816.1 acyl-CoA dehydrogenase [Mycolicibacterium hassiacum]MDA4086384.1 acyl-CoA dehydrogenase [Mycolicibacterium hassiacum DSM 44199]PZN23401.1 MAG: acyl-CoA dehydrogenase [Mycolicibacterium hassiacum]VCT91359.1 Acyl-CoA dehydrogenase FadE27 [Mycolicibacterium hassiacum DSM 44199]
MSALSGGVFDASTDDEFTELRRLVDDIGKRSFDARQGRRTVPDEFDADLWQTLSDTGLTRLTSDPDLDAGPAELAVVLHGIARYAGSVPLAETDALAAWLATTAGIEAPDGPLTVAIADAEPRDGRLTGTADDVPWTRAAAAILLLARGADAVRVGMLSGDSVEIADGHNLAGEPRDRVSFEVDASALTDVDPAVAAELSVRGSWCRCMQMMGALDAAATMTVSHTGSREQFGRPLSKFQAVQHSLAAMAGEIERARAAASLAVAAAADYGFAAPQTSYAVTVARVAVGRAVIPVTTIAHQLHGAIGVTAEHPLWTVTTRAQSWATDFGSTVGHARRLGRMALAADDPWDLVVGLAE